MFLLFLGAPDGAGLGIGILWPSVPERNTARGEAGIVMTDCKGLDDRAVRDGGAR